MTRAQLSLNLFFVWILWIPMAGSSQSLNLPDSIKHHASELIRNQDSTARERAYLFLNEHMGEFLTKYKNFDISFPEIDGLAVLEDLNLKLRIVTYELYRDTSTYVYGGWIQTDKITSPVFLKNLTKEVKNDPDLDYMTLDQDQWYGALYYQWHPLSISDDEWTILLFGFDNYHFFTKRKILETMVVRKGSISFGKPVIEIEPDLPEVYLKKRFILDYSVQAAATLRFDDMRDLIIFDHLTFMKSDLPKQHVMRVPDGTYAGFKIDPATKKLIYIEKVFDQVMDEAPGGRVKPAIKRDLFGNPQRN